MGNYFDYVAYEALCQKIGEAMKECKRDAEDDFEKLEKSRAAAIGFFYGVGAGNARMISHKFLAEEAPYIYGEMKAMRKDMVEALRKTVVPAAISMNLLAEKYGTSPIFTGDINNSDQVSEFCRDVTSGIFENRTR